MREQFVEYYPRTDAELASLWRNGLLVLDTNVLLGFYDYPQAVLDDFMKVLEAFGDRLWLPYQVGNEYHKNRHRALPKPRQALDEIQKSIAALRDRAERLGFPEFHPTLDIAGAEERRTATVEAIDALNQHLSEALSRLEEPSNRAEATDTVRTRIEHIFSGRIGIPFADPELEKIKREADLRYASKIPPGFKDLEKDADAKYGDFIIWQSLLTELKARTALTGVLFVTNDRKDDWWIRSGEQLLGPRTELVRECLDSTGRLVHLYLPSDFLKGARDYLSESVPATTVDQVERLSARSPVTMRLRALRMELPAVAERIRIIRAVRDAVIGGTVRTAGEIRGVIEECGSPGMNSYVSVPLFFALISEAYGPLTAMGADTTRLRDRPIAIRDTDADAAIFIRVAHVAWLAQALFRLQHSEFTRQELADALLGVDASEEAFQLLVEAERALESDLRMRGQ